MKINNKNKAIKMIETVKTAANYCSVYTGVDSVKDHLLGAMQVINREDFVPDAYKKRDYDNGSIPIGFGQTIPQPFIVELMMNLLDPAPDNIALEVGTGSGFQAAILSCLVKKVYSIEKIPVLAKASKNKLRKMGLNNIEIQCGDGYYGWQEKSPFDSIIVTAAAPHIPESLIQQLKPGGRMVLPVGAPYSEQMLVLVTKDRQGAVTTESILPVAFMPLVPGDIDAT